MVRKRYILFRDQLKDFCKKGWESKVIGGKGNIILVEAEVPDKTTDINENRTEEMINEPGEC